MTENIKKKYHIETMGCQMNERDSETISGLLSELGYEGTKEKRDASVLVVNTCSVRDNADKRFFGVLGQLKKIKESTPEAVVAVCGCMMQQQHIVDTIKGKYPWVDIVFGTHNIHEFPGLLRNVQNEKTKIIDVWAEGGEIVEGLPSKREFPYKAFVNIMYGCNNFCTYCIVPYTRGRERSRNPEEILSEIEKLAQDGVKEVMLLGQNVNSYKGLSGSAGKSSDTTGGNSDSSIKSSDTDVGNSDSALNVDFSDLLERIDKVDGIERIRFMTSHPKDLSDELIDKFKTLDKLCPSIHLPVQSGSTEVLERMNRKYTKEGYLTLIEKLRAVCPHIVVTTDFIVGFPGETEEDFEETMDLIEKVRFDSAFTFIYSVRKGTPAENFENQIPEAIKHKRFNRMVKRLNEITLEKNRLYVGRTERVLTEGESKTRGNILTGRTSGGKLVNFEGSTNIVGQIIDIKITEVNTFSFTGKII